MKHSFSQRELDAMMEKLGPMATETDAIFYLHKTQGELSEDRIQQVMDALNLLSESELRVFGAQFGLTMGE